MNREFGGLANVYGEITGIEQTLARNRKPHVYRWKGFWRVRWGGGGESGFNAFRDLVVYMRADGRYPPRERVHREER